MLKGGTAAVKPAQKEARPAAVAGTGKLGSELRAAAAAGDLTVVKSLLARGADPNAADVNRRKTPLHLAAAAGHLAVVKALLAAGADPSLVDSDGFTPAERARDAGYTDVVAALKAAEH